MAQKNESKSDFYLKKEIEWYQQKNEYLKANCIELSAYDFYREIFPEGSFERKEHFDDKKPNTILVLIRREPDPKDEANLIDKSVKLVVTDDLEDIDGAKDEPFAIMSPVSYFGRNRASKNASEVYGFAIDLDGCDNMDYLRTLFHQISADSKGAGFNGSSSYLAPPTLIANSGHGLHLYYIFDKPVRAYKNVIEQLNTLKRVLTRRIWTEYNSSLKEVQYQSIWQGFRVVGTGTKFGIKYPVTGFKYGEKISLEKLISYLPQSKDKVLIMENMTLPIGFKIDIAYKNQISLDDAQKNYPDWYMRKVIGTEEDYKWHVNRALYDWFLDKIKRYTTFGHRYFCIRALTSFAVKCDIDYYELSEDAFSLFDEFNKKTPEDKKSTASFKKSDITDALSSYDAGKRTLANRYKREFIELETAIPMPPSIRRNGRIQKEHLEEARMLRDIRCKRNNKNWREGNGRIKGITKEFEESKTSKVIEMYLKGNPTATKKQIKDATGLTYPTIRKWYDEALKKIKNTCPYNSASANAIYECLKNDTEMTKKEIQNITGLTYPTIRKWYEPLREYIWDKRANEIYNEQYYDTTEYIESVDAEIFVEESVEDYIKKNSGI